MKTSTYTYQFTNGAFTITKGIKTKFDWFVEVELNPVECEGYVEKRFIKLDQNLFLTLKNAKETTIKLLTKFNLL